MVSGGEERCEIEISRLVCLVEEKPKNAASGVVFPGVQKSTWDYDEVAKNIIFIVL